MENAPEWFLDLFLDFVGELNKPEVLEKFRKYGSSKFTQKWKHAVGSGYAILQKDAKSVLFIGKLLPLIPEKQIEIFHFKHNLI